MKRSGNGFVAHTTILKLPNKQLKMTSKKDFYPKIQSISKRQALALRVLRESTNVLFL